MKITGIVTLMAVSYLLAFGVPVGKRPSVPNHYGSPELILPMTFAHRDHTETDCVACHHNFIDDTGVGTCMDCHVTNQDVWPLLEEQFHGLCRECHVQETMKDNPSGPVRQCIDCHMSEAVP